jgi:hypothetical protein
MQNLGAKQTRVSIMQKTASGSSGFGARSHSQSSKYTSLGCE